GQNRDQLVKRLSTLGVIVAPVLSPGEIAADETLKARGHLQHVVHPEAGSAFQSTLAAKFSHSRLPEVKPAPLQGQHSLEVFRELLQMSEDEYRSLCERELSGTGPSSRASVASQA
ncbi:MAG: CoA transferase, partial [Pseudomonadales bacterium]